MYAHRGGSALAPENTIPAFDRGLASGADGLELDVHLSADGVPVVHHDATLDRTTDAAGPVTRLTAAQLARVDAGWAFEREGAFPFRGQGIGVPTLREVLVRYAGFPIIIEMKMDDGALARAVVAEVQRADAVGRVCLAGFGGRSARAARAELHEADASAHQSEVRRDLYLSWLRWPLRRSVYGGYQIPEVAGGTRVVSPRFIAAAHRAGLKVQVWTVDDDADMARLLDWGVDALITNRPDLAVQVRDRYVASR